MPLTQDQLQRSWVEFKVYKDPQARVSLINHYSYLVKITAGRLVTTFPGGLDREDLIGNGVIGLIKSVDQYDPTRDVKFETYAIALIRGAILEMLRDQDWVPRSIREKMKAVTKAQRKLEPELGREPTAREISEEIGIVEHDVSNILVRMGRTNVFSLDDVVGGTGGGEESIRFVDMIVDSTADTIEQSEGRELRRILAAGVDRLPDRERLVVGLYYFEGLTFKEIGKVLGVSESRVYQLHTQAMGRLRSFMQEQGSANVR